MVGIRLFPFGAWPMFRCYMLVSWSVLDMEVVEKIQKSRFWVVSEGHFICINSGMNFGAKKNTKNSTCLDDPRNTCKCVLTEWFKKHPFVPILSLNKWVKNPIKTLNPWDTQSHHYSVGNLTPCDSWISAMHSLNASLQLQVSSATASTISRWWKVEMPRNRRQRVERPLKFGIENYTDDMFLKHHGMAPTQS